MRSAHQIATSFDQNGLGLAGVLASCMQDRRNLQAAVDAEQADRNLSAAGRAMRAVRDLRTRLAAALGDNERLRGALVAQQAENARLVRELAATRQEALRAKGLLVRHMRAA